MEHATHGIQLELLSIYKDDLGSYAKIHVTLPDGEITIRWGLDSYTYDHLSKVVFLDKSWSSEHHDYRCFLLTTDPNYRSDASSFGWLSYQLGTQHTRVSFSCSPLYLSNLAWLKSVESVSELKELSWDHWLEHYVHVFQHTQTYTGEDLAPTRPQRKKLISNRFWVGFVVLLACVLSGGYLGVRFHVLSPYGIGHRQSLAIATLSPAASFVNNTENQTQPLNNSSPTNLAVNTDSNSVYGIENSPATNVAENTASSSGNTEEATTESSVSSSSTGDAGSDDDNSSVSEDANDSTGSLKEVFHVPPGEVALTIDDGPSPYTEQILHILSMYHVHATFFFVGVNVEKFPQAVSDAAAQGNEIGDHTIDHPYLTNLSYQQQEQEIVGGAKDISQYTHEPVILFRPPYDAFDSSTKQVLIKHHMLMALWNQDPKDWEFTTPDGVLQNVYQTTPSGSVIDLHDREATMLALPRIIQWLQKQNLTIVTMPLPPGYSESTS